MSFPFDYLHVDTRRVDAYFDQIHPEPTYDKVPEWSGELSLLGLRAEATQKMAPRRANLYERIAALCLYLDQRRLLVSSFNLEEILNGVDREGVHLTPFVLTTIEATKVTFPRFGNPSSPFVLWVHSNHDIVARSRAFRELTSVCLIEDFAEADEQVRAPQMSAYSALVAAVRARISSDGAAGRQAISNMHDLIARVGDTNDNRDVMLSDPLRTALDWGGEILMTRRRVEVLCRIREYTSSSANGTHVLAYPIFVRTLA